MLDNIHDISSWLESHHINNYKIRADMTVDVEADVTFHQPIKSLSVQFNEVHGNFEIYDKGLETLEGSPRIVHGSFNVSHNQLTSLKGGPLTVMQDFEANVNQLTSLRYSPQFIGKNLNLNNNLLQHLQFICPHIKANIYVNNNYIKNFFDFDCDYGGKIYMNTTKKFIFKNPELRNFIKTNSNFHLVIDSHNLKIIQHVHRLSQTLAKESELINNSRKMKI